MVGTLCRAGNHMSRRGWLFAAVAAAILLAGASIEFRHRVVSSSSAVAKTAAKGPYLQEPSPPFVEYRRQRLAFFRASTLNADVVMLGDSITEGGEWAELLGGVRVLNRGIRWDTSDDVLARLDEVINRKPRTVFLLIGINDLRYGRPVASVAGNVRQILQRLSGAGIRPVVQSTLMLTSSMKEDTNARVGDFNEKIRAIARETKVPFVDLNAVFAKDGALDPAFSYDGIHLNSLAYLKWCDAIRPYI
jgi:lysophospholipase L1-like esterase